MYSFSLNSSDFDSGSGFFRRLLPSGLFREWDWPLSLLLGLLLIQGIMTVHSATKMPEATGLSDKAISQIVWIGLGMIVMAFFAFLDYRHFPKIIIPLYVATVGALVFCKVHGTVVKGARRWVIIAGVRFQPSEMAKLVVVIAVAMYLARLTVERLGLRHCIIPFIITGLPAVLVLKQPDMGTALSILAIPALMLLIRGFRLWVAGLLVVMAIGGLYLTRNKWWDHLEPHQKTRIEVLLGLRDDPKGVSYQIIQAKIAVGSGLMFGKGYTLGTQHRLSYLPEHHTDFIFGVLAEDWGWSGVAVVLGIYFLFLARGVLIAVQASDMLGFMLAGGVVAMLFFQVFVNLSMVIGLAPVTGIPLPLISYGGTNLLSTLAAIGIIFNVRMRRFASYGDGF